MHHSPCTPGVTPRRPVKLYYSSGSKKCPSSAGSHKSTASSDVLIPGTHEKSKKLASSSPNPASVSSDWKDIPSPLTNGQGVELDNCDALLAELGLSPMPQKIPDSRKKNKSRSPSKSKQRRRSSPRKTPSKTGKGGSVQPSPLRNQIDHHVETKSGRNSLYKKLFQMKPKHNDVSPKEVQQVKSINAVQVKPSSGQSKTSTVSAKLRVGADLLPAKSVKPLTVPREFSFATDQRLKRSTSSTKLAPSTSVSSIGEKRTNTIRQVKPPTQPMSPKFSKRVPFVRPVSQPQNAAVKKPVAQPRITIPREPNFATASRIEAKKTFGTRPETKVTIPKSPNFSIARPRKSHIDPLAISAQTSFLSTPFKARPAPKFGKPFEPVLPHRHTVSRDINLSKRQKLESDMAKLVLQTPARKTPGIVPSTPKQQDDQENRPRNNLLTAAAKKITIPRSPNFSTNNRIRQRHLKSNNQP